MSLSVPTLDLHSQFKEIEKDVRSAIDRVLKSQHFILGPEVEALEKEVSEYVGSKYAVGVSSGSDALLVALMALGIKSGDEVITTPHTFFATVGAIVRVGAKPVFLDIEPNSFNLDPNPLEKAITPKTKAVISVHLFGQCADMDPILSVCKKKNIFVIEDAAQAIGTEYQGKRAGSMGTIGCFSFYPSKNLGAMGDGGMVTTQDSDLWERLRIFRAHGSKPKYFHKFVGGNFRLDGLQAAILRAKLSYLDRWTQKRQELSDRYDRLFHENHLTSWIRTPWRRPGDRHIFNQYVVYAEKRDGLKEHLKKSNVQTEIYYPVPMHKQECFKDLGYREGDFPVAEKAAKESLALPLYPELSKEQQDWVVQSIQTFYR